MGIYEIQSLALVCFVIISGFADGRQSPSSSDVKQNLFSKSPFSSSCLIAPATIQGANMYTVHEYATASLYTNLRTAIEGPVLRLSSPGG